MPLNEVKFFGRKKLTLSLRLKVNSAGLCFYSFLVNMSWGIRCLKQ